VESHPRHELRGGGGGNFLPIGRTDLGAVQLALVRLAVAADHPVVGDGVSVSLESDRVQIAQSAAIRRLAAILDLGPLAEHWGARVRQHVEVQHRRLLGQRQIELHRRPATRGDCAGFTFHQDPVAFGLRCSWGASFLVDAEDQDVGVAVADVLGDPAERDGSVFRAFQTRTASWLGEG